MRRWTFLSNHAQVLLCIARHPSVTTREIGEKVGITERAAQNIVDDLEAAGYLTRHRHGRRNWYELHTNLPMRHRAQEGLTIRDLLELLSDRASLEDVKMKEEPVEGPVLSDESVEEGPIDGTLEILSHPGNAKPGSPPPHA